MSPTIIAALITAGTAVALYIVKVSVEQWRKRRDRKRAERAVFILNAMGNEATIFSSTLPRPITGVRFDLYTIETRLRRTQMEDAAGAAGEEVAGAVLYGVTPEFESKLNAGYKRQKKLGIPTPDDPERNSKLERLLQEMEQSGRLHFDPPNMWTVL